MIHLDFGDHRPLYEQIKEKLKELIITGVLSENEKIPSVRELASSLAINPNTIQKAYKDLESEGYIYSRRASGSFVAPREVAAAHIENTEMYEHLEGLLKEMLFCGIGYDEIIKKVDKIYGKE